MTVILQQQQTHTALAQGDPWRYWSAETIARVSQCPLAAVERNWPLIDAELTRQGVTSEANCAAAIGTTAIETASTFAPVREAFWMTEDWREANLRYYPYYGRGFIQLTWQSNYQLAGDYLGVNLASDPDRALETDIAAAVFAWYWAVARPGIPRAADNHNWAEVRRLVQGGSSGLQRLTFICNALLAGG